MLHNVHAIRSFPITAIDVVLIGKREPKNRLSRRTAANRRDAPAALERMEIDTHPDMKIGMVSGIDFILSLLVNKFRFSTN